VHHLGRRVGHRQKTLPVTKGATMQLKQAMHCLTCDEISLKATCCPICQSTAVLDLTSWIPPRVESTPNMTKREKIMAEARDMIEKMTIMQHEVENGPQQEEPIGVC
jgi:hypothetical protein